MRRIVACLAVLACNGKEEELPEPEPVETTPPEPTLPPEPTGPPEATGNADTYDFGLTADEIYAATVGVYEVTCVGESSGGFLGPALLELGPGKRLVLMHADGTVFQEATADGSADYAQRETDVTAFASWRIVARGEGPTMVQQWEVLFTEDGSVSVMAVDPTVGSVHCVDYASTVTLDSGETPPALLTGLSGSVIHLEGAGDEAIDLTVSADGTVTIDQAPFDAIADFTFDWTGGVDLVEVDLSAGDWAVTWPDGTWMIVIKAEGAAGNYGITLTGDATGLTGVVTDLFLVGDPPL